MLPKEGAPAQPDYSYRWNERAGMHHLSAWVGAVPVAVIRIGPTSTLTDEDPPRPVWTVHSLHVLRPHRGRGLARTLHERAHAWVVEQGGRLRVLQPPKAAYAAVWEKLRAQRVALEGGEEIAQGVSAVDPSPSRGPRNSR